MKDTEMLRLFASFLLALVAILGLVHAVPLEKRDEHTPAEAAALARQLVTKTRIAELATKFHSSTDPELEGESLIGFAHDCLLSEADD